MGVVCERLGEGLQSLAWQCGAGSWTRDFKDPNHCAIPSQTKYCGRQHIILLIVVKMR